jgi:isoleucyl-tRNA synthetase
LAEESALVTRWTELREVRAEVTKAMEAQREAGKIGSSLQAEVEIPRRRRQARPAGVAGRRPALRADLLEDHAGARRRCRMRRVIAVLPTPHVKCARCWHWREDVGSDTAHP